MSHDNYDEREEEERREMKEDDLIEFLKQQKQDHELPNGNGHDYNRGYVKAMNDVINYLTK